jgi:hypothetical protein
MSKLGMVLHQLLLTIHSLQPSDGMPRRVRKSNALPHLLKVSFGLSFLPIWEYPGSSRKVPLWLGSPPLQCAHPYRRAATKITTWHGWRLRADHDRIR